MQNKTEQPQKVPANVEWAKSIWGILPTIIVLILLISITMMASTCYQESKRLEALKKEQVKEDKPLVNVVVLPLTPTTIRDRINFPGVTEPWVKLDVLCEINGKVLKKEKLEGEPVQKGEVIARIDDRDYVNALNSARAAHNLAELSLIRLKGLYKAQLSTESELDGAVAQVAQTKAALDSAMLNVERCIIKSPINGTLNRLYIEEGQYLNTAAQVAEVLQLDRIKIKVGIPESDMDAVRKIDSFDIVIDALGNKPFVALKHFLSKTADSDARLYDLDLVVPNPQQEILPDMFTRVEIVKQVITDAVKVPMSAIISINNNHKVFIVNDDIAHERNVETGLREGFWIQIKTGLKFGEKVVVEGQRNVNDGRPVKVVRQVKSPKELH